MPRDFAKQSCPSLNPLILIQTTAAHAIPKSLHFLIVNIIEVLFYLRFSGMCSAIRLIKLLVFHLLLCFMHRIFHLAGGPVNGDDKICNELIYNI